MFDSHSDFFILDFFHSFVGDMKHSSLNQTHTIHHLNDFLNVNIVSLENCDRVMLKRESWGRERIGMFV